MSMTLDEKIAVIKAHEEGKRIELNAGDGIWFIEPDHDIWNFSDYDYRIKPEPEYIPFETVEEVKAIRDKWIKFETVLYRITAIKSIDGYIGIGIDNGLATCYSVDIAFNKFLFEDGTPFGKLKAGG